MSVFKKSSPLLLTSFVNKCGTIGLSLVPILLVERHVTAGRAGLIMLLVKSAFLAGTFIGGVACDRLGVKVALLLSFAFAGAGLGLLPLTGSLPALCALAVLAQLGQAMFPSSARFMLTRMLPVRRQQEAIGWLRTANNLGQVISFSIGWGLAAFGTAPLMFFDALTSFLAAGLGWRVLPWKKGGAEPAAAAPDDAAGTPFPHGGVQRADWRLFFQAALITAAFSFLYDLYMVATPARFRMLFGEDGLALFSQIMVVNTVLCAGLAVVSARWFKNPNRALPLGIILNMLGCLLSLSGRMSRPQIFAGALVMTLGEIVFMSLSSYVVIRLTPRARNQGSVYSGALVVQGVGRILGGGLAFPLIVHGAHPEAAILGCGGLALLLWWIARPGLARKFDGELAGLPVRSSG